MLKKTTTINDRVSYVIDKQFNGNKKKFAESVGFAAQVVSNIVSGRRSKPSYDVINAILSTNDDLSANWLLTGKGEMLRDDNEKVRVIDNRPILELTPENPMKTNTFIADVKASAGFGTYIDNKKKLEELPAISLPNVPLGLNVAFQISGDSMHPTIRHLDYVAANQVNDINDIRDGYPYIIVDKDDGVLCKRIYREGGGFKIVSDNPSYPPYKRTQHDILGIFKCFMRLSTDFRTYNNDVRNAVQELRTDVKKLKKKLRT